MKYKVDNLHREFFTERGWIEFEELLTPKQLRDVNADIDAVLSARLGLSPEKISKRSPDQLFGAGRDVWRDSAVLKKLIISRRLAEMANELVGVRPLRLAFDQVYSGDTSMISSELNEIGFGIGTLHQLTSFQGMLCGLLLCLQSEEWEEAPAEEREFFPRRPGSGVFFSADLEVDYSALLQSPPRRYLLIGYSKAVTLFIHRPADGHAVVLKQFGYNYGDRLADRLHPIVYR